MNTKPTLWKNVPSEWFDFQDIYDEAVETAPYGSILIEVGSFWGQSAIYLAEAAKLSGKGLKVYAIDTWTMNPSNNPSMFAANQTGEFIAAHIEPRVHQEHHNSAFETFSYYIEQSGLSPDPLRILRMDSLEAAQLFAYTDNIHFIFLDDDHEYDHVISELYDWDDNLMITGIIAGHDYTEEFDGVKRATYEYFLPDRRKLEVIGRSWIVRPDMITDTDAQRKFDYEDIGNYYGESSEAVER